MPTPAPLRQHSRNSRTLWFTAAAVPLALAVADDVRIRRRLVAAGRDELTGLPRRQALTTHGEKLLTPGHRADDVLVLVLDGDRFKDINDTHGHAAGDRVVVTLAHRLHHWCQARRGLAARLGGDEFGALVHVLRTDVGPELAHLRARLNAPIPYEDRTLSFSTSVGAAHTADLPGRPWNLLLRAADTAMYRAKSGHVFPCLGTEADALVRSVNGRRPGRPGTHLTPTAVPA